MSTSLPFLYQTKSLAKWNQRHLKTYWQMPHPLCISNQRYVCPSLPCLHTSTKHQYGGNFRPKDKGGPRLNVSKAAKGPIRFYSSRSSPVSNGEQENASNELRSADPSKVEGWTENKMLANVGDSDTTARSSNEHLDDIYDTASIYEDVTQHSSNMEEFEIPYDDQQANDAHEEEEAQYSSSRPEFEELKSRHGKRASTITNEERVAFQRIFADIFGRNQTIDTTPTYGAGAENSPDGKGAKEKSRRNAASKLESIMSNAIKSNAMAEILEPTNNVKAILERLPESLRGSAAKAFGVDKDKKTLDEKQSQPSQMHLEKLQRLEALREPERIRVEELMRAAKTDFELWKVMENEVFSLIEKLGLQEVKPEFEPVTIEKTRTKRRRERKALDKEPIIANGRLREEDATKSLLDSNGPQPKQNLPIASEDGVSQIALYGPLYPSYVLLGLRLLDRSFARPSPLTFSLLPKIKSLGSISHVLGASTQFYNELLRIYRYRLDDLSGMVKLLTEMERGALDMDKETYEIVVDVLRTQASVRDGAHGYSLRALWRMSRYAPSSFRAWRDQIAHTTGHLEGDEVGKQYDEKTRSWRAV